MPVTVVTAVSSARGTRYCPHPGHRVIFQTTPRQSSQARGVLVVISYLDHHVACSDLMGSRIYLDLNKYAEKSEPMLRLDTCHGARLR